MYLLEKEFSEIRIQTSNQFIVLFVVEDLMGFV